MTFVSETVASKVLPAIEDKLPKVITSRAHGLIDYAHAAFFISMALVCRKSNKPAALAAMATGSFILAQSLLTDYPMGAKPLISFSTHGKMDAGMASASWLMPKLLGFSGTPAAKVFEINSVAETTVLGLTNWDSDLARLERIA